MNAALYALAVAAFSIGGSVAHPAPAQAPADAALTTLNEDNYGRVGLIDGAGQMGPNGNTSAVSTPLESARRYRSGAPRLLEPKIVGGRDARLGDDLWQVALVDGKLSEPQRDPFCGGSIVAARWVITAAHCVDRRTRPSDIDIVSGTVDLTVGGRRVKVVEIIIHEDWKRPTHRNDIALLRLAEDVGQPSIPLISNNLNNQLSATELRVTGWGAATFRGPMTMRLQTLDIAYIGDDYCNDPVSYAGEVLDDVMLCAGFAEGGRDSCSGDSGGPLTAATPNGRVLAGIVSWGKGCAEVDKPGVYTRVAAFLPWIADCMASPRTCQRL